MASATSSGTVTRDGNTWTKQGTISGPDGRTAFVDGTAVKDGKSIQSQSRVTNEAGKTLRYREGQASWGNGAAEGQWNTTGPRGGTKSGTWTRQRDGSSVNRSWRAERNPSATRSNRAGWRR